MLQLKAYQIHFDSKSKAACYRHSAVNLYDNTGVNPAPFFENAVIESLIKKRAHHDCEFFGVWSWQHGRKLRNARIRGFSIPRLIERIETQSFDVLSWYGHLKKQQIFHNNTRKVYNAAFDRLMFLMDVDFSADQNPRFIVMQNHFIARSEIYERYVLDFLVPAMRFMQDDERLAKLLHIRTPYKAQSKVNYTFHTFICERLFSTWLHLNPSIKCQNWQ